MSEVRVHNFAISLDGYGTGEPQSLESPFGHAGERLHEWMFATRSWRGPGGSEGADNALAARTDVGIGAEIMGANKFGPPGWQDDPEWKGWWGVNPPFHSPTFVLTHRPVPPMEMEGGTTFHLVTDGIESALEQAVAAANGQDVRLGGGVSTIQQYLAAGLVDELHIAIAPVRGKRSPTTASMVGQKKVLPRA